MSNKDLPRLKEVSNIPEELLPVWHWWQDRGPKTLAYVAGALIVAGAIVFWYEQGKSARAGAVVALNQAAQTEDYEAIVSTQTPITEVARLDLAKSLYEAEDYEGALTSYDVVLATLDDVALRDIAAVGRICALEALGRLDEAMTDVTALEGAFAQAQQPHYLQGALICAKARILCQQGNKDAAKQALAPLLTAADDTPLANYKEQAERTAKMIDAYTKQDLFAKAAALAPAEQPATPEQPAAPEAPAETPAAPETPAQ